MEDSTKQSTEHGEKAERKFKIVIDEDHIELSTPQVTGGQLMDRVRKRPCRYALVQIIPHGDDQFIDPEEKVDLTKPGTEKFVTVLKDVVQVQVDGTWFPISRGSHPINDIKTVARIDLGYRLALDTGGKPKLKDLPEGSSFDVQGCEVFESRPPAGGAS